MPKKNITIFLEFFLLILILALASCLRFVNADIATGWYNDEGTVVNIARNLLQGKVEYLGITQSTLLAARPPLFPWILSIVFRFLPPNIATLRLVTASLGVLTTLLMFLFLRKINLSLAFLSTLIYAVYPLAVIYSRIGFSYNLCALWMVIVVWGMHDYLWKLNRRGLVIASFSLGLAIISEFIMFLVIPSIVLCVLWKRWRDLILSLLVMATPFLIYLVVLLISAPQTIWYDLTFAFLRVNEVNIFVQIMMVFINFGAILIRDSWVLIAIFGVFFSTSVQFQKLLTLFLILPLLLLFRSIQIGNLSYYYLIPWIPLLCLGMSGFILWFLKKLLEYVNGLLQAFSVRFNIQNQWVNQRIRQLIVPLLVFITIVFPVGMQLFTNFGEIGKGNITTPLDMVMIPPEDGQAIQEYILNHYHAGDLILASPALAWTLPDTTTDYQISLAAMGYSVPHFPSDIPADRLRFDMDFHQARFVITDNIWNHWAIFQIDNLSLIAEEISTWDLVFQSGEVRVFENPN
jgi:4-amino-4-deoxy-L-arabinose transferase-like glycosyltransferase